MRVGRVTEMFERLRGERSALIAYATGYFPDRETSEEVIREMLDSGADAVEVGLPFSDPVMDGPVIQETSKRALKAGSNTTGVLDLVSGIRKDTQKPLLVMSYYNPVFCYGTERFARDAAESGVDGVIVPDLPAEEMLEWKANCDAAGLETVAFCAMTTTGERIRLSSSMSSGFLYCISLLGTTGARDSLPSGFEPFMRRVRSNSGCPLAVGVGISTPQQVRQASALADGVIVGSALMRCVMEKNHHPGGLSATVRELAEATEGLAADQA